MLTIELPSESLHVQILKNGTPLNGEVEYYENGLRI